MLYGDEEMQGGVGKTLKSSRDSERYHKSAGKVSRRFGFEMAGEDVRIEGPALSSKIQVRIADA